MDCVFFFFYLCACVYVSTRVCVYLYRTVSRTYGRFMCVGITVTCYVLVEKFKKIEKKKERIKPKGGKRCVCGDVWFVCMYMFPVVRVCG